MAQIEGYAIVYNTESLNLGGFTEMILPEATNGMIQKSDVICLMDHDPSRGILARTTKGKGSLTLTTDYTGLKYSFEAPHTALGTELVESIKRGDIRASSFQFTVRPEGESFRKRHNGSILRIINQFDELYDVSPCAREAYVGTSVTLK